MKKYSERKTRMEVERLGLLVRSLASSMPSTLVNTIIVSIVLWEHISQKALVGWCVVNILFVLVRYRIIYRYRQGLRQDDFVFWKRVMVVSFLVAGGLFGYVGVFLLQITAPEHIVFVYFVVGGMVAGSLGSYHNNLSMFFSYSMSVFLLPTAVLFIIGSTVSFYMAILGLVFFTILSINALRMNRDLKDFLNLRYDNNLLVEKLNREKINTEKLNSELVQNNEQLKMLSRVDPLTGLKNRHYLFDVLKPRIEKAIAGVWVEKEGVDHRKIDETTGYGVLSIDIDHFKRVNDTYGHDSGDMVLMQFSDSLVKSVRDEDVVGRIGGEEFVVILKNTREGNLVELAEKIRSRVENSIFDINDDRKISITCSLGVIFYPFYRHHHGNLTVEHVFYLVDRALYFAKQNGRNRTVKVVCTQSESNDIELLKSITANLSQAIDNGQIIFV